jgi:hypothetical protein
MDVCPRFFCVWVDLYRWRPCDRAEHLPKESYHLSVRSILPVVSYNYPELNQITRIPGYGCYLRAYNRCASIHTSRAIFLIDTPPFFAWTFS